MSTESKLLELDRPKLEKAAAGLGIDPKGLSDVVLSERIEKAAIKRTLRFEREAAEELRREREQNLGVLGKSKRRPSPQDVAIKFSRKVIVLYKNLEHPAADGEDGADWQFTMGQHSFHLYDNHRFVMPECLVTEEPLANKELLQKMIEFWVGAGLPETRAKAQAVSDLLQICLVRRCAYPIHEMRQDPRNPDRTISVLVRYEPRCQFTDMKPAPKNAVLGDIADPENQADRLKTNEEIIRDALTVEPKRPEKVKETVKA